MARSSRQASSLSLLLDVFKLRIGIAISLAALAGLAITPGRAPAAWRIAALAVAVIMASAAAGAFNQYIERDIDAKMRRTRGRAFVTGRFTAGPHWLISIAILGTAAVGLAGVALSAGAAVYTALGAITYGVIYTVWLKRRTPWNIVVGGLAGSFAVLAGAAAVSPPSLQPLPLTLALILFLWTPPHFWSLAIAFSSEYAIAGVPMLPVVVGNARAARTILAGAALLVPITLLPAFLGMGWVYLIGALTGGAYLLARSVLLARRPNHSTAMANFHASLFQLTVLLVAAIADVAIRG